MNLCISSLAWDNNDRLSVYELLQKNDIHHLEIVLSKLSPKGLDENIEFYQQCKQEWESFGLKAVSMQSIHFGVNNALLFGAEDQQLTILNATKKAIDIASILKIPNLVFGSPKLRVLPEGGDANFAVTFFKELNVYAQTKQCYLNIEANSSQYGTNFLVNTQEVKNFLDNKDWQNIGINLDLSTLILENEDISSIVTDTKGVRHVHISIPFLKTDFKNYKSQIKEYITAYKMAYELTLCVPNNDVVVSRYKNQDVLSIEMVSQETNLALIQEIIDLIKEYL